MTLARILSLAAALVLAAGAARAQAPPKPIRIAVLNDQSGPYATPTGMGSVVAARLAVEDAGGKVGGVPVEVLAADHQNKPDVGSSIAREWIDRDGVNAILDVPTSSVALAVNEIVRTKDKVLLVSGGGTADLTGKACSPNTIHWTYDTWALANTTGRAVVQAGGDTWFFLTVDYAFGHALERDVTNVVKASGGRVLGAVRHPLNTADFSSFLLQAQASRAKIVGLANAGGDTSNAIKQASEFGIVTGGQKLAALLALITDVHALGLPAAQGLQLTEAFYWDLNDQTRTFARRFAQRHNGNMPTMIQAGVYSAVWHYLKALAQLDRDAGGRAVIAKMKELPTDDPIFGKGAIREDGRKIHPMLLFEVKKPSESKGPWDYYKLVHTVPAAEAFRPLDQGDCPLVKKR
jgi:branched-chain amino acid transport system substrate-binding protein